MDANSNNPNKPRDSPILIVRDLTVRGVLLLSVIRKYKACARLAIMTRKAKRIMTFKNGSVQEVTIKPTHKLINTIYGTSQNPLKFKPGQIGVRFNLASFLLES